MCGSPGARFGSKMTGSFDRGMRTATRAAAARPGRAVVATSRADDCRAPPRPLLPLVFFMASCARARPFRLTRAHGRAPGAGECF